MRIKDAWCSVLYSPVFYSDGRYRTLKATASLFTSAQLAAELFFEVFYDGIDRFSDIGVGQGSFFGTEYQRVSQALIAFGNLFTRVHIEEADGFQVFAAVFFDDADDVGVSRFYRCQEARSRLEAGNLATLW